MFKKSFLAKICENSSDLLQTKTKHEARQGMLWLAPCISVLLVVVFLGWWELVGFLPFLTKVQALGCREDKPLSIKVQGQDVMVVEEFVNLGCLIHSTNSTFYISRWSMALRNRELRYAIVSCMPETTTTLNCHHSCCHAEPRKSDLEVTARYLNEVEAVQHVHLTNIPVWFGLLGDIKDGRM